MCQPASQMLEKPPFYFLDITLGSVSALPEPSECQGRLIISNVPFPKHFSPEGESIKLA